MKALLRGLLATGLGSGVLLSASLALAAGEPCFNDTDCPGAECGGEVCNWNKMHASGTMEKPYTCNAAGTDAKGKDGWCTTADNCKCKAQGATCNVVYCSFTKASDAPGASGSGAGGSASTAGAPSTAGTPSTAGAPSTAGTSSTAGSGGTAAKAEDEGGCSVASPGSTGGGIALALGVLGLGFAVARRRR